MGYRKFKLVNSLDQTYELTDQNYKQFLNNPTGLGYSKDLEGVRVGNRFKVVKRQYDLPSPRGELVFYDEANEDKYDAYANFVQFAAHYPLRLYYYAPTNNGTEEEANSMYLSCEVITADKSQVVYNDGTLRVPVTFRGFSFWLSGRLSQILINKTNDPEPGNYTYPLSFPFSFGTDLLRNLQLPNNGSMVTPVVYNITGRCVNPYIRFFDKKVVNGVVSYVEYAASKIIGTYDTVYVNANDNEQNIVLTYDGATISNPAVKQDLSLANVDDEENEFYLTFLKIKPGTTYATITFDNEFVGTIDLNWRDEFVSI